MPRRKTSTTTQTSTETETKTETKATTTNSNRGRKKKSTGTAAAPATVKDCTITTRPKNLLTNLNLLATAISSNVEAKDRLLIEIASGKGKFIAGHDLRLVIQFEAKGIKDGSAMVGCRQLKGLTATLDNNNHKLSLEENKLVITNSKSTYRTELPVYQEEVIPDETEYTPIAKVKGAKFKAILERVMPFVNSDNKEITSGILLKLDTEEDSPQLLMTGASGIGMARGSMKVEEIDPTNLTSSEWKAVIPKKALQFIAKEAGDFTLETSEDSSSVRFIWNKDIQCTVTTLKGEYPDLDSTLEQAEENDLSLRFNREELLRAVRRTQVMSADITFEIEGDNCKLSHANSTSSSAENIYCDRDETEESIRLDFATDILRKTVEVETEEIIEFSIDSEADAENPSRVLFDSDEVKFVIAQQIAEEEEEEEETEI